MRCNCENSHCPICDGHGCKKMAGSQRAMYIGGICDGCALHMPAEYLVPATMTQAHHIFFEQELPYRGDHVMVEATREYELLGPWDDEGNRWPLCNPIYLFRVYEYNELTQNYEVPISDQLTEDENFLFNKLIYEARCDEAVAYAESRRDRD